MIGVLTHLNDSRLSAFVQLAASLIAFWPVWRWYCERSLDRSDEPLSLVALVTVLALSFFRLWQSRKSEPDSLLPRARQPENSGCTAIDLATTVLLILLMLLYCGLSGWAPPAISLLIAFAVVVTCLCRTGRIAPPTAGDCALLVLSCPLLSALNFYAGYPLRVLATKLAAVILNLGGLVVHTQGAEIISSCTVVGIDPPCSGIKMLWAAVYIAATLAALLRLQLLPTLKILILAFGAAIAANAIRVSSLFYLESGLIEIAHPFHELVHISIGSVVFILPVLWLLKLAFDASKPQPAVTKAKAVAILPGARKKLGALTLVFMLSASVAAAVPFLVKGQAPSGSSRTFNGWPRQFEGQQLKEVPLSSLNQRFAREFPGKIAVFSTGRSRIVFRWVTQPTRQLHDAANCYRAGGYAITWRREFVDAANNKWSVFQASKDSENLYVRERIFDESGTSWTDVSSWYWAAVLKQSSSPWWAVSVAEPLERN
jgi:exosortase/archaeosortase family protein